MIYDCYWAFLSQTQYPLTSWATKGLRFVEKDGEINVQRIFASIIHESKDDYFVFAINTNDYGSKADTPYGFEKGHESIQYEKRFTDFLDEYGLRDLVVHTTDYGITNEGHYKRGIKLWILASKDHWYRELAKNDPEITEENFINYVDWPDEDN